MPELVRLVPQRAAAEVQPRPPNTVLQDTVNA